ncbi:cuticle collagen 2C-like [Corvus kubaryi]|uniref:cuticle collagen 2C-like n=1 Tax=Corvus kubaryi TaxID=68294 RepID=UPI001C052F23|nr:cuticle collagen 2C-like [Corvus kubaryi]
MGRPPAPSPLGGPSWGRHLPGCCGGSCPPQRGRCPLPGHLVPCPQPVSPTALREPATVRCPQMWGAVESWGPVPHSCPIPDLPSPVACCTLGDTPGPAGDTPCPHRLSGRPHGAAARGHEGTPSIPVTPWPGGTGMCDPVTVPPPSWEQLEQPPKSSILPFPADHPCPPRSIPHSQTIPIPRALHSHRNPHSQEHRHHQERSHSRERLILRGTPSPGAPRSPQEHPSPHSPEHLGVSGGSGTGCPRNVSRCPLGVPGGSGIGSHGCHPELRPSRGCPRTSQPPVELPRGAGGPQAFVPSSGCPR